MSTVFLQHQIDLLLDAIDGELVSRSRVFDGLLDLRNGTDDPLLIARIDGLLADVPGGTTVENTWWMTTLEDLRGAIGVAEDACL